ncbi:MAG TPA: hypothetical protein VFW11_04460 [Cyclobacteriaceae bacterium]|nr:hypothetical protein [Cyclobacteriaceae bacterium]
MEPSSVKSLSGPALSLQEHAAIARAKRSNFYVIISVAALLIVLAGFSRTYVVPMASGTFAGRPLVHIHGALYFCWIILFIVQPTLARTRNIKLHRKLGVAGFILAGAMLVIGISVAITGARLNSPVLMVGGLQPKQFLLIPITDMILFATFLALSLVNLKKPETHKRLMVLATVALLPAAFGRLLPMLGIGMPLVILLFQESIVLIAIARELIMKGKVHPVYLWGGSLMLVVHFVRFPLAATAWWTAIGDWLIQ